MEALKDKITKASKSTNAGFKRKKIRSMKREVGKINEKLRESEKKLELVEPRVTIDPICGAQIKHTAMPKYSVSSIIVFLFILSGHDILRGTNK